MSPRQSKKADCPGDRFWVPAGAVVHIAGYRIGGMVYAGSGLDPVAWGRHWVEPALLDPLLPVARRVHTLAQPLEPRPSYFRMSPSRRTAYLRWLEGGRQDTKVDIGFVFLFFSGIERRVLADARVSYRARSEVAGLIAETERLLDLYGGNTFFRSYAEAFLLIARLLSRSVDVAKLTPPPRPGYRSYSLPLVLRAALGAFAARGERIPPEWAYAWACNTPDIRLGTPADSSPDEFKEVFKLRYTQSFPGGGIRLRSNRKPSAVLYYPASPSFYGSVSVPVKGLPRELDLAFCRRQLQEVVNQTVSDLRAYSRRMTDARWRRSPAAASFLPPELARLWDGQGLRAFFAWIEGELAGGEPAPVPAGDLIRRWSGGAATRLVRGDAERLASFLGRRGYGMEPDVRLGGPPPDGKAPVVLFRQGAEGDRPAAPGSAYRAAAVLLHLAVLLASADGPVNDPEERVLLAWFETSGHLPLDERKRLAAHLIRLMADPPGFAGLKPGIAPLSGEQRRTILRFLIVLAEADGSVQPEELKLLRRIYSLLGLEAQSLYSDVHAVVSADAAVETVTGPPTGGPVALDAGRVRSKLAETEVVGSLLEEIFREEEPGRPAPAAVEEPSAPAAVAGLDGPHSAFLLLLAEKAAWRRAEVDRLAATLGLLPDGALEVLNETAFERCGAPLLDGDETLEVDAQVLGQLRGTGIGSAHPL